MQVQNWMTSDVIAVDQNTSVIKISKILRENDIAHLPVLSKGKLVGIRGSIPSFIQPPLGCRFHPRCPQVMPICRQEPPPPMVKLPNQHQVACHLFMET